MCSGLFLSAAILVVDVNGVYNICSYTSSPKEGTITRILWRNWLFSPGFCCCLFIVSLFSCSLWSVASTYCTVSLNVSSFVVFTGLGYWRVLRFCLDYLLVVCYCVFVLMLASFCTFTDYNLNSTPHSQIPQFHVE